MPSLAKLAATLCFEAPKDLMNNTKSLQELFQDKLFRIPNYQRGYAWEKQQVGEFLEDLELLDSSRCHYTGTIVLHQDKNARERTDNQGRSYTETDVVDGQQRLTTIILLLSEISRALGNRGETLANGIRKDYVKATDMDGHPLYKLTLNDDIDRFFRNSVLAETPDLQEPTVESALRLREAKDQIAQFLARVEHGSANQEWLQDLHKKVTTRLRFNLYEVDKAAEVGIIFEVMNDRGRPLTDLEKIKNYLLYVASSLRVEESNREELGKEINSIWSDILKCLMNAKLNSDNNENRLLRTHWLIHYDSQSKQWKGSKSIRDKFNLRNQNHSQLLSDIDKYINGLYNSCISFCDVLKPNRSDAFQSFSDNIRTKICLWSDKIVRMGVTTPFLPLFIAMRIRWPSDHENYLSLVQLCEKIAFRIYRVAEFRSDFNQLFMLRLANAVRQGKIFEGKELDYNSIQHFVKINYNQRKDYEGRDYFEYYFIKEAILPKSYSKDWYSWKGIKYFLYEYEEYLASDKGASPEIQWKDIKERDTIEHILPQAIAGRCYWKERFNEEEHQHCVDDIGNLMLTKHNSFYSNKPFFEKKGTADAKSPCYANSPLFQEREIAALWDNWTPQSISERRGRLLDWAKSRWYIDFGDGHLSSR